MARTRYRGVSIYVDTDGLSPCWRYAGGGVLPDAKALGVEPTEADCKRRIDALIDGARLDALRSVTRQLDMVKVYITDPTCREVTERKINDALAVLKAAGVEVEG